MITGKLKQDTRFKLDGMIPGAGELFLRGSVVEVDEKYAGLVNAKVTKAAVVSQPQAFTKLVSKKKRGGKK